MRNKEALEQSRLCENVWRVASDFENKSSQFSNSMLRQLEKIGNHIQEAFVQGEITHDELLLYNKMYLGFFGYKGDYEEPDLDALIQN